MIPGDGAAGLLHLCFQGTKGFVETASGSLQAHKRSWTPANQLFVFLPAEEEVGELYFGPAVRQIAGRMGKANCSGSAVCWVDVDNTDTPMPVLPATCTVWSGHGWHLYWKLDNFCSSIEQIEQINIALASTVKGDSAHNVDRMLRVPGTFNLKDPEDPVRCRIVEINPARCYPANILEAVGRIPKKVIDKIRTGDRRGYRSRSERDLAVMRALTEAGFTKEWIQVVFQHHACGDKYRDPATRGEQYLDHSMETLESKPKKPSGGAIATKDNCYYYQASTGVTKLSTFTFTPTLLLEGVDGGEDSLVGDVRANNTDHVWRDEIWPRSAFSSLNQMSKQLKKASWCWLGRDAHVRALLAWLVARLTEQGIPRAVSVNALGRHTFGDRDYFVANDCTLASDGSTWFQVRDSPVVYVPTGREAPQISLTDKGFDHAAAERLIDILPQLNEPEAFWPCLGWFMATPYKPKLEQLTYRFPILNVTGTRGSGKTTLLLQVLQPLLGVCNARGYDANTTRFVALSLLGSANAIPVNFSEFRATASGDFLRFILLAYDSGRDARGRPDQTTVEYPLSAPFTLDGEDRVDDPAALERVVAVALTPKTIREGGPAWKAMNRLRDELDLTAFALPYLLFTLKEPAGPLLAQAAKEVQQAFPSPLPDRIRRNLTVAWFGVLSFAAFMAEHGVKVLDRIPDGARVLAQALENVYSSSLGRAATAADSFVEFVVNVAAQKLERFPWALEQGTLWFQLTPAFEYYLRVRSSQRQQTLSRDAIRLQLRELVADYTLLPEVRDVKGGRVLAYGVNLSKAHAAGLDIPESFATGTFVVEY